jgi:hypothetical protein
VCIDDVFISRLSRLAAPPANLGGSSSNNANTGTGSSSSSNNNGGGTPTSPASGFPAVQDSTLDQLITAGNSLIPPTPTTTAPTTTGGAQPPAGVSQSPSSSSSGQPGGFPPKGSSRKNVLAVALPVVLAVGLVAAIGLVTVRVMRMKAAARVAHASMAGGLQGRMDQFTNLHTLSERGELSSGSAVGTTARKRASVTHFQQGGTLAAAATGGSGKAGPALAPRSPSATSNSLQAKAPGSGSSPSAAVARSLPAKHNSPRAAAASPGSQLAEGGEVPGEPEEAKLPVSRNVSSKAAAGDHFGLQAEFSVGNTAAAADFSGDAVGSVGAVETAGGRDAGKVEASAGVRSSGISPTAPPGRKTLPPLQLGLSGARLADLAGLIRSRPGSVGGVPPTVPGELLSPGLPEDGMVKKRIG